MIDRTGTMALNKTMERDITQSSTSRSPFAPSGNELRDVHVRWFGDHTPYAMAEGFKVGADELIRSIINDPRHPDMFFFPIAFLYRHYLELQLKNITEQGSKLLGIPTPQALQTHDLDRLWNTAKEVIAKIWPEADARDLDQIDTVVADFHCLDRTGQAFRYYRDTGGQPHLQHAPPQISLDILMSVMNDVYDLLTGCETGIAEYLRAEPS